MAAYNFNDVLATLTPLPGLEAKEFETTKKYLEQGLAGDVAATSIQVGTGAAAKGYTPTQKDMLLRLAQGVHERANTQALMHGSGDLVPLSERPMIAVAGPAGVGKSTFALRMIADLTGQTVVAEKWKQPMLSGAMNEICARLPVAFLNVDRANLTGLIYPEVKKLVPNLAHDVAFYHEYTWGARFLGAYYGHLAVQKGLTIVDDATYGSPGAFNRVTAIRVQGRPAYGIVIAATDKVRAHAIRNREAAGYVQSTGEVTSQQAEAFAKNLPFLFEQFDATDIMVRFGSREAPVLAGTYSKDRHVLQITNLEAFEKFCSIYGAEFLAPHAQSEFVCNGKSPSVLELARPAFKKIGDMKRSLTRT